MFYIKCSKVGPRVTELVYRSRVDETADGRVYSSRVTGCDPRERGSQQGWWWRWCVRLIQCYVVITHT